MPFTVAILGAGRMGSAIGRGLKNCGHRVLATRAHRDRLGELAKLGFEPVGDNAEAAKRADVVIIAVKPWVVPSVAREISGVVKDKIVVSVAAGVPLRILRGIMPGALVYRAMPNLGVEVGLSLTGLAERLESGSDRVVEDVFRCLGEVYWIPEKLMPVWTGVVGSGPGILASLADAMILALVKTGVRAEEAGRIVASLLELTGRLLARYGAIGLRDAVATPGGTTIEGIVRLEDGGRRALIEAFLAAVERARRLEEEIARSLDTSGAPSG